MYYQRNVFSLAKFMKKSWAKKYRENKVDNVFFDQYVDLQNFNSWNCAASTIPDLVPDNNPHERTNLKIKGSKTLHGIINPGQDYLTMLTRKLPNLIRAFSLLRVGVEYIIKINQEDIILHPQSKIMEGLLNYSSRFVEEIDMGMITSKDNEKTDEQLLTYLVNTENYLGLHVTKEVTKHYFDTLKGNVYATEENRSTAYAFVESFCLVNKIIKPDGFFTYYGNCHAFFKTTYCNHCARFVYK